MLLYRFYYTPNAKSSGMSGLMLMFFKPTIVKRSKAQGYGLHSQEECKKKNENNIFYIF